MEGVLKFYKLEKEKLREIYSNNFGKGLKTCSWNFYSGEDIQLAMGDTEGKLFIFDLEKQKINYQIQAHSKMINSLDSIGGVVGKGPIEIATGSRDGKVHLWDPRQTKPVLTLESEDKEVVPDCWSVALGNAENHKERCLAAGYDNGDLKIFDLRKNELIMDENLKNGVCGIEFDRKDIPMNKLVATALEGKVSLYDMRTCHPVKGFSSMQEKTGDSTLWGTRHLPQNREIFGILGGDGILRLQKYNYPSKRSVLDEEGREMGVMGSLELLNDKKIAEQPIVGFDWNNDKLGLAVSCALDQKLKIIIVTKLNKY